MAKRQTFPVFQKCASNCGPVICLSIGVQGPGENMPVTGPGFFGAGERFKPNKEHTPGPGEYDAEKVKGFKADPKSGFLTGDRFGELEREGGYEDIA